MAVCIHWRWRNRSECVLFHRRSLRCSHKPGSTVCHIRLLPRPDGHFCHCQPAHARFQKGHRCFDQRLAISDKLCKRTFLLAEYIADSVGGNDPGSIVFLSATAPASAISRTFSLSSNSAIWSKPMTLPCLAGHTAFCTRSASDRSDLRKALPAEGSCTLFSCAGQVISGSRPSANRVPSFGKDSSAASPRSHADHTIPDTKPPQNLPAKTSSNHDNPGQRSLQ